MRKGKRAKDEEVNGQGRKGGKGDVPAPCGATALVRKGPILILCFINL